MAETIFDKMDGLLSRATAKVTIINDGWAHGDLPKGTQDVLWQLEEELEGIRETLKKAATGKENQESGAELSPRDERLLDSVKNSLTFGCVEEASKRHIEFVLKECHENPTREARLNILDKRLSEHGQNAVEILQAQMAELSPTEHEPESRA